jgi:hypothetical protein
MADDKPEFSKDSIPAEYAGAGVWYRSTEMVHAIEVADGAKVGGKNQDGAGFVIVSDPLENKSSKVQWMDAAEFNEKYAPAGEQDRPYNPGPHFDSHEASEDQAQGYQMEDGVEGDRESAQVLQDPRRG